MSVKTSSDKLQPPKPPKILSLKTSSRAIQDIPFFIYGDEDTIKKALEGNDEQSLYESDDIFAVGLGHLYWNDITEYLRTRGELMSVRVRKLMYVIWATAKIANAEADAEVPDLVIDNGVTRTPYGDLPGSLLENVADIMLFVLSRRGRIVGMNPDHTYIYEAVSEHEIGSMLDESAFFVDMSSDGEPMFFEVIASAGLHQEQDTAEVKEDGPKNSPTRKRGSRDMHR